MLRKNFLALKQISCYVPVPLSYIHFTLVYLDLVNLDILLTLTVYNCYTNFFIYPDPFLHHLARINEDQMYIVHIVKGSYSTVCTYVLSGLFHYLDRFPPPSSPEKRGSSVLNS